MAVSLNTMKGEITMKVVRIVICILVVCMLLIACGSNAATQYEEGHRVGYDEGYAQGYLDGVAAAQRQISDVVTDDLSELCREIEAEWGIDPEEAARLLSNYADIPDEVDESDVPNAIWAIYSFYHDSWNVVNRIDSYIID